MKVLYWRYTMTLYSLSFPLPSPPSLSFPPYFEGRRKLMISMFSRYKYSLTGENLPNINDDITEKIYSPFVANTVPIYFGSSIVLDIFDSETFFYVRNNRYEIVVMVLKVENQ
jgi:hypothetical protein